MTRWLALLAGLAVGLLALLPARLLLPAPPLSAANVEGSIWQARLATAGLGGARLGDLEIGLMPAALLNGRAQWQVAGAASGRLWRSLAGAGIDEINGTLAGAPLAGLPVNAVELAGVSIALDGRGRCQSASGAITVTLAMPLAGQRTLSGAPRCDGGALSVPMASGDGRVRLDLAAMASGWQARLAVSGAGPAEAAALSGAGFRSEGGTLVRQEEQPW